MRISRDKLNKLGHTVLNALKEREDVEIIEDPNVILEDMPRILEELLRS